MVITVNLAVILYIVLQGFPLKVQGAKKNLDNLRYNTNVDWKHESSDMPFITDATRKRNDIDHLVC